MNMNTPYRKGQITVFLSLMLVIMISFLLSLVRFALIQLSRDQAYVISEMAIESIMGEFNRTALEKFDLFLMDGGYGTGNYSEEEVISHYEDFVSYETSMDKELWTLNSKALNWGCSLENSEISALELATDNGGSFLREQIACYMEDTYGVSYVKELFQNITGNPGGDGSSFLQSILDRAFQSQDAADEEAAREAEKKAAEQSEEDEDSRFELIGAGEAQANALRAMQIRNRGSALENWVGSVMGQAAYGLVVKNKTGVSEKTCDTSGVISKRRSSEGLREGYGTVPMTHSSHELSEALLFKAYLLTHFEDYFGEAKEEDSLDYQLEYILCGGSGDRDNLGRTASKLLLIRSGINLGVLLANKSIRSQVDGIVTAVCAAIPIPGIKYIVEGIILVLWSIMESVVELRDLFDGGKMVVAKTAQDWRTSPEKLPQIIIDFISGNGSDVSASVSEAADSSDTGGTSRKGLNYSQWLMLLIGLEGTEKTCYRYMDLVEMTIWKDDSNPGFRMDNCIVALTISNSWRVSGGGTYSFDISYCYR